MLDKQKIIDAVLLAVDEINLTLPPGSTIEKRLDAELSGPGGVLDSMGMVNLVVETEQQIEDAFGVFINLADEKAMSAEPNPFKTIETLVLYIAAMLGTSRRS